jgi:uncharacterized iron-regulated protein
MRRPPERENASPGGLVAQARTDNLLEMEDRQTSRPDRRALGRAWIAAGGLALLVAGCAPGGPARPGLGADHPLAGRIYQVPTGRFVDQAALTADLQRADFVLLGERHANPEHQRLEALVVEALAAGSTRPRALAFEMIPSDRQLALVEYRQRHPDDPDGLGRAVGWAALGWPDWALYAPIAEPAFENGAEIVAADLSPAQTRAVFRDGVRVLQARMVRRTGLDQELPANLAAGLARELSAAACDQLPEAVVAGLFRVERARDAMMADRLATVGGRSGGVLIAGNGQVRTDRGVPWYLARMRPQARIVSVGLLEVLDGIESVPTGLPFDYVWFTPRVGDDQPCAGPEPALRRLEGPLRS